MYGSKLWKLKQAKRGTLTDKGGNSQLCVPIKFLAVLEASLVIAILICLLLVHYGPE